MKRRVFLGSALALAVASAIALKPRRVGGPHKPYFESLSNELKRHNLYKPKMLVDLDSVDQNIDNISSMLNPQAAHRIPVKSLPSIDLLEYVMRRSNSNRLMVFHQPFLNLIAKRMPNSDVLFGKPMPVALAKTYYQTVEPNSAFDSTTQLQWLVDTKERLDQYLSLAKELNQKMRINVEIDIGLHRGGLLEPQSLLPLLDLISDNNELLEFSGFMGYDPHVVKLPGFIKSVEDAYADSQSAYQTFIDVALSHKLNLNAEDLTFNGAGSPTLALHSDNTVCNDLTAGSCIVKPSDFDIATLDTMLPAAFISSPVLKQFDGTLLPAGEQLGGIIEAWDPNKQQTLAIYGGKWKASYVSPNGIANNPILGLSTNQQVISASNLVDLKADDFVFLRPHQSEFVFLQFGDIRTIRSGILSDHVWPVFSSDIV
ncbi:MAG: D-serine deaminase-like pyridoxal phosphate-dependent protein [Arenicella sp.]|jgi:D-serine deaminase-like pyridoxal phosphate-dependent protein